MSIKKNMDIRIEIMKAGLREWQVGAKLNLSAPMFSNMLKKELSGADRERITQAIAELKADQEAK